STQEHDVPRTALVRAGYVVLEAPDARQALKVAEGHRGRIHLLLTDVVMPGMGGRDLANALVALRPDLRVLLASGYTDEALRSHGMNDRGFALLQKPFTPDVLRQRVREVLDAPQDTPSVGPPAAS
ncbi:MAG: response regulator, partial [Cytophagaceae bacterium]|nr:response regulator [Gemmatimonadaceae bacterium]